VTDQVTFEEHVDAPAGIGQAGTLNVADGGIAEHVGLVTPQDPLLVLQTRRADPEYPGS
jgi:hypothetical protein